MGMEISSLACDMCVGTRQPGTPRERKEPVLPQTPREQQVPAHEMPTPKILVTPPKEAKDPAPKEPEREPEHEEPKATKVIRPRSPFPKEPKEPKTTSNLKILQKALISDTPEQASKVEQPKGVERLDGMYTLTSSDPHVPNDIGDANEIHDGHVFHYSISEAGAITQEAGQTTWNKGKPAEARLVKESYDSLQWFFVNDGVTATWTKTTEGVAGLSHHMIGG